MIKKIKEILTAYNIMLSPKDKDVKIAAERLSVCETCPEKRISTINIPYCNECGCVLKAKAFSKEPNCPLGKWER